MYNEISKVFYTDIRQSDVVIYSSPLTLVYNLRMTYLLSLRKLAYYGLGRFQAIKLLYDHPFCKGLLFGLFSL